MKNMFKITLAGMIFLAAGCGHRYKTYQLLEEKTLDNTAEPIMERNKCEDLYEKEDYQYEVKRSVLVDKATGDIYYFSSDDDTLVKFNPEE